MDGREVEGVMLRRYVKRVRRVAMRWSFVPEGVRKGWRASTCAGGVGVASWIDQEEVGMSRIMGHVWVVVI